MEKETDWEPTYSIQIYYFFLLKYVLNCHEAGIQISITTFRDTFIGLIR